MLLWNALIALVWCWLLGSFSIAAVVGGFLLGFGTIWLMSSRDVIDDRGYVRRVPRAVSLLLFYLYELVIANMRVAKDLLTPGLKLNPVFLAIPLDAKTDAEITVFVSFVTLTPGSISIEVSEDKSTLFIYSTHAVDIEREIEFIKNGFERRILEVMR